jgi:hypothetical protein
LSIVKRYSIFHKFQSHSGSGLKLLAYYHGEEGFLEYLEPFIENLPERRVLCITWKFQPIQGGEPE